MSSGIPKSARDVLAKQTAADVHLSPDLLNAYVERALSDAEKQQVTLHLAACADCREVVFLASAAGEEQLESALVAAAPPRIPQRAAATQQAQQPPGCAVLEPRRKRPTLWWKWALPLTAVVIVGAAVLVERDRFSGMMSSPPADIIAAKRTAVEPAASGAPATAPNPTASASTVGGNTASSRSSAVFPDQLPVSSRAKQQAANKIDLTEQAQKAKPASEQREELALQAPQAPLASKVESPHSNALAGSVASAPPAAAKAIAPPPPSQSVEVTSAAPLVQADNADLSTNAAPDLKTQAMAKSLTGDQLGSLTTLEMERSPAPAKVRWRISKDGHLEHTVGPSTWERVMAAEPVIFRVVATVGNNVWAGGSDGALFHSSDGGKHWDHVGLSGEQGAITSIHFSTAQQGSLTSDSSATWTTTDGGQTWSKQ